MPADDQPRSRSGDERDSSAPVTEAANHNGSRNNDHKSKDAKKRKNEEDAEQAKKPKVVENRAIFVSNLPPDADETEIEDAFKKYGIIDQGTDGNPRIKMYADKEGNFTGEALVVYFKKESIKIAVDMMDDYWFRVEEPHRRIHVQEADASFKRNTDGEQIVKKMSRKDRKANERNRAELNRKLAEWSDDEEDEVKKTYAPKKNKHAKICIVKHAFTLEELDKDEDAIADITGDMQEEAEKHGEVTKVVLYDEEEDGVLTIRFSTFEEAESFRAAAHNRSYGGRHLQVTIAEDRPRFKRSKEDYGHNQDLSDDEAD